MASSLSGRAAQDLRATRAALNQLWRGQGQDEALAHRLGLAPAAARALQWLRQALSPARACAVPFTLGFDDACPGHCLPRQLRSVLDGAALPVRSVRGGRFGAAQSWVRTENFSHNFLHGSLGAILRRSNNPARLFALTAGHVFGGGIGATGGDTVSFTIDGESGASFQGRLFDWMPGFGNLPTDTSIDAGLAEVTAAALSRFAARPQDWPTGTAVVGGSDRLRLMTRNAPIAGDSAETLSAWLCINGDTSQCYQIVDALCWQSAQNSQAGDSGGPVWNDADALVAIHAGSAPEGMAQNLVAVPIAPILDWAGARLVCRNEPLLLPQASGSAFSAGTSSLRLPANLATVAPLVPGAATPSQDTTVLARTMWGEARGLNDSLEAVANVVLNRVELPRWWGKDVVGVCHKPWQFSCWNRDDPNLPQLLKVDARDARFAQALASAAVLLAANTSQRLRDDPTQGATHYFAWRSSQVPNWALGHRPCTRIGGHDFYNDIN